MTKFRLIYPKPATLADLVLDGVQIIKSREEAKSILPILYSANIVGVDTETIGSDVRKEHPKGKAKVFSLQLTALTADKEKKTFFIPNWGEYSGIFRELKNWFNDEKPQKVLHNAKYDMHVLANHGVILNGLKGDTLIMDYIHYNAEGVSHALKACISRYFSVDTVEYSEAFRKPKLKRDGTPSKTMYTPSLDEVIQTPEGLKALVSYACKDTVYTVDLYEYLCAELRGEKWSGDKTYLDYYEWLALPYTTCLFRMERNGVLLDVITMEMTKRKIETDLIEINRVLIQSMTAAGLAEEFVAKFNPGSPKQVGKMLIDLGVRIEKTTPTGLPCTDDDVLAKIKRPEKAKKICEHLLELRTANKLLNTYIVPLLKCAHSNHGRVHASFNQTGTATARLSSSNPNLQNIPRPDTDKYGIRKLFIAPLGHVIGDIDMSQIEIRLTAHFTGEPLMLQAIQEGWDIHSLTALRVFPEIKKMYEGRALCAELLKEVKEKFPVERTQAKGINFGTLYGMGAGKFAEMQGINLNTAKVLLEEYFNLYPLLKKAIHRIQNEAHTNGYVASLLRRRMYLTNINSSDTALRSYDERRAFNFKIQGSCSDIMQMAMVLIDRDPTLKELGVRMVLQVHDELVFEIPEGAEEKAKELIESYMSEPYKHFGLKSLRVETPADLSFGPNWGEAKS